MTNYAVGHRAERVAARWLQTRGYKVFELNWKHPRAEVDMIGQAPSGSLLFVEVKYRATSAQGSGLAYITPAKLRQMTFAADLWVAVHNYTGLYELAAIEVSGPAYEVTAFIDQLT